MQRAIDIETGNLFHVAHLPGQPDTGGSSADTYVPGLRDNHLNHFRRGQRLLHRLFHAIDDSGGNALQLAGKIAFRYAESPLHQRFLGTDRDQVHFQAGACIGHAYAAMHGIVKAGLEPDSDYAVMVKVIEALSFNLYEMLYFFTFNHFKMAGLVDTVEQGGGDVFGKSHRLEAGSHKWYATESWLEARHLCRSGAGNAQQQ